MLFYVLVFILVNLVALKLYNLIEKSSMKEYMKIAAMTVLLFPHFLSSIVLYYSTILFYAEGIYILPVLI